MKYNQNMFKISLKANTQDKDKEQAEKLKCEAGMKQA